MPRKPKYIPKDYENEQKEIESIKKKRKYNFMVAVPINYSLTHEYKFCLAGDININLKWFTSHNTRISENYDGPYKGLAKISIIQSQKLVECQYYSKTYQQTDFAPIIKSLENTQNQAAIKLVNRLRIAQSMSNQQQLLAKQLVRSGIMLNQQYATAKGKAGNILNHFNSLNIPFTYAIQQYNWDYNQLEKTYNGVNFELYNIYMDQQRKIENVRNRTTALYNSMKELCLLIDPYSLEDDIREMVVTTQDGILLKSLNIQKSYALLPSFFYVLKIRLLFFDADDLQKLHLYRQKGVLHFPLQKMLSEDDEIYETKSYQEPDFIDYSPHYNTQNYFSISNISNQQLETQQKYNLAQNNQENKLKINQSFGCGLQKQLILPINDSDKVVIVEDQRFQQIFGLYSEKVEQKEQFNNTCQSNSIILDKENTFRVEMARIKAIEDFSESLQSADMTSVTLNALEQENQNNFYQAIPLLYLPQTPISNVQTSPSSSSHHFNQNLQQNLFLSKFYPQKCLLQNNLTPNEFD